MSQLWIDGSRIQSVGATWFAHLESSDFTDNEDLPIYRLCYWLFAPTLIIIALHMVNARFILSWTILPQKEMIHVYCRFCGGSKRMRAMKYYHMIETKGCHNTVWVWVWERLKRASSPSPGSCISTLDDMDALYNRLPLWKSKTPEARSHFLQIQSQAVFSL